MSGGAAARTSAVAAARTSAVAIAREAIGAIDVEARVRESLASIAPVTATAPIVVAAVGKAAPAMTRGALAALSSLALEATRTVVVTADGTDARGLDADPRVRLLRAAHPIPDARSVAGADALLEAARGAGTLIALVSGGASALACAPVHGLSLADKQALVAALLDAGAPITDVNLVRRHLSRIKGGGLARAAAPAPVHARIVSDVLVSLGGAGGVDRDVVGGAPIDIGSGPAVADPTSGDDARAALARWAPSWLPRVGDLLSASRSERDAAPLRDARIDTRIDARIEARVVASPFDLAEAAAEAARARGLQVIVERPSLDRVDDLAVWYAARARGLAPGTALVRVAEPSVPLPAQRGAGGRAGRLALATWVLGLPDDVELACVASDGVDGSSRAAGACVRGGIPGALRDAARAALERYDDGAFLAQIGRAVAGAPSGTNLLDVHVLVRGS
ncbi:MAG: glycerate kinase [Deltaproteobacteria bacterium]|nr:glycerate kinase [Deltaproteobacteria bacterium]